ncbi:hypothetical protein J7F01_20910 [Streptomyces sp. ISL-22]|uniref:hypothetical protein n=1 Tax=unclassified Streptomyces TaxID=2593676 RepID=UPI001BE53787|nr:MULTISPECIES: hypothetical protein [unclassified Streptomyces]MBT2417378.1 hypothetical protein [Streptomyces sp. ISL-24]MBT2434586.1 hypothetical protein [Streptomyces sp. ISL-22]
MRRNRDRAGWPAPRDGKLTDNDTMYALPSNAPGYNFHAHLTGRWEETPAARQHHDPRAAAAHHALETARAVTRLYPLTEHQAAQAHINSRLGTSHDLVDAPVRLLWARLQLTADTTDVEAVVCLQRRIHDEALNEQFNRQRQHQAEELHRTLSTTPTLALAYWLIHQPQAADPNTIEALSQLTREITSYAPHTVWVQVAHLLQTFVQDLDTPARMNLVDSLAQIFTRYDQPELADHLSSIATQMQSVNGHSPSSPPR